MAFVRSSPVARDVVATAPVHAGIVEGYGAPARSGKRLGQGTQILKRLLCQPILILVVAAIAFMNFIHAGQGVDIAAIGVT